MRVNSINDFSAIIRGRRLSLGLTQAELADRAGMTRQSISLLEHGRAIPSFSVLLSLLDTLDLDMDLAVRERRDTKRSTSHVDLDVLLDEHRR